MTSYATPAPPSMTCLKRRNSSSNSNFLDCHSLQSSLKRVRLSRSPGELRLQRDLKLLSTDINWNQVGPSLWTRTNDSTVQLQLMDPQRLCLQLDSGRIWIQIPRMYPHRPPVISRIEGLWMERIVVHEAVPYNSSGDPRPEESIICCGTTVVFNRWNPVMTVCDLIDFCITTTRSPVPPTTAILPSYSTSISDSNSVDNFVEEHKMEDATTTTSQEFQQQCQRNIKYTSPFQPNRFDVGYGRFSDSLSLKHSQEKNQSMMDVN